MSALSQLLDRLRRLRLPPGAAAGVLAVPSAGEDLSAEVAFLFGWLDATDEEARRVIAAARGRAVELEAAAREDRRRLLAEAEAEAERVAAALLARRAERWERRRRAILDQGERDAAQVLARGRARTPALVTEVVQRVLETGR